MLKFAVVLTLIELTGYPEVTTIISTFAPKERYDTLGACLKAIDRSAHENYKTLWSGMRSEEGTLALTFHCEQR